MKTQKMTLANIQGKMSRSEMKNTTGGSAGVNTCYATCPNGNKWGLDCTGSCSKSEDVPGGIVCGSTVYTYGCAAQ